jgi:hypothetical protein
LSLEILFGLLIPYIFENSDLEINTYRLFYLNTKIIKIRNSAKWHLFTPKSNASSP